MSRRTSDAAKAIRKAWLTEKELVEVGKGTRDWSEEEQKSIIDKGKAYDADGKAYEGHHMKSAEAYPEFQGEAENIQFLTRNEHRDAHYGYFCNATNGYYDPITKITCEFEDDKYEPCSIIQLTTPIIKPVVNKENLTNDKLDTDVKDCEVKVKSQRNSDINKTKKLKTAEKSRAVVSKSNKDVKIVKKLKNMCKTVAEFYCKHQNEIRMGIEIGVNLICLAQTVNRNKSTSKSSRKINREIEYQKINETKNIQPIEVVKMPHADNVVKKHDYPKQRSSPREHMVSAGGQHYRKNGELVWIEKKPYPRGGKKS